jgi:hypothetical protein
VVAAIARVFNSAATADRDGAPNFVVGDFNGDGAEDVAVVTKPNEAALPEINHELANWTLEDPREVTAAAAKTGNPSARPKAVKAERNDRLLAIIHGIGPQGWRHPEARQAFLLRNAAGTNVTVQMARPPESPANSNSQLHGDAISETLNGQRGFIFWTGAKYAWAPQR